MTKQCVYIRREEFTELVRKDGIENPHESFAVILAGDAAAAFNQLPIYIGNPPVQGQHDPALLCVLPLVVTCNNDAQVLTHMRHVVGEAGEADIVSCGFASYLDQCPAQATDLVDCVTDSVNAGARVALGAELNEETIAGMKAVRHQQATLVYSSHSQLDGYVALVYFLCMDEKELREMPGTLSQGEFRYNHEVLEETEQGKVLMEEWSYYALKILQQLNEQQAATQLGEATETTATA